LIYRDHDILITKEFIKLTDSESEAIPITAIQKVELRKEVVGNYRAGAILFFVLGILSIWFMIGFLFLAWGIAAWNKKIYTDVLLLTRHGVTVRLHLERPGHVHSILNALMLSQKWK